MCQEFWNQELDLLFHLSILQVSKFVPTCLTRTFACSDIMGDGEFQQGLQMPLVPPWEAGSCWWLFTLVFISVRFWAGARSCFTAASGLEIKDCLSVIYRKVSICITGHNKLKTRTENLVTMSMSCSTFNRGMWKKKASEMTIKGWGVPGDKPCQALETIP